MIGTETLVTVWHGVVGQAGSKGEKAVTESAAPSSEPSVPVPTENSLRNKMPKVARCALKGNQRR
jgi:hypothetical protein